MRGIDVELFLELGLQGSRTVIAEIIAKHVDARHGKEAPSDVGPLHTNVSWFGLLALYC